MGGVGVIPPLTHEEILAARFPNLWPANPDPAEHNRRSIYLQMKRSLTLPLLQIFDAPGHRDELPAARKLHGRPAGSRTDERRVRRARRRTNSPRASKSWRAETPEAQVETGWKLAFGRAPTATGARDRARLPEAQFAAAACAC